ncbi:hypothetical protein Patl1_26437 [Pistacia atlantica]|uniref:Uncharacterized protein n=1 Tax=Pistacia atlantica TaxID=434234 RepID=A0ACC1B1D2_9ROSI|nr:hypothetical protein Patl1_26437 [Pistacia atlantica]
MEARTMEFDPHLYFQVGKETISEGMKRLQNLAHWYNSIPEKAGLFDEIITYLQSLQRQIKVTLHINMFIRLQFFFWWWLFYCLYDILPIKN